MTDYSSFKYGAVTFPLAVGSTSLLHRADPAIFYLLEFYESVLETHLGARVLAEIAAGGLDQMEAVVGDTLPLNPEPYLVEEHIRFPLRAAYRKNTKLQWIGKTKHSVDEVEVAYVLPPLQAGEAERLMPLLKAVVSVLDNRTEMGFDPAYTPSEPTGAAGDSFWKRAGLVSAGVMSASYGGYAPTDKLYFPAVLLNVEIKERSDFAFTEFEEFAGISVDVDIQDPSDGTTVADVAQFETEEDFFTTESSVAVTTESLDYLRPED
jgi:hypothetical protein